MEFLLNNSWFWVNLIEGESVIETNEFKERNQMQANARICSLLISDEMQLNAFECIE